MTGQCCVTGPAPNRRARRVSGAAGSILPAVLLVLLPKCPLCLAAWLTVATGVSFTATSAAWVHWGLVLLSCAVAAPVIWHLVRRQQRKLTR